jgi:hypothetical protein
MKPITQLILILLLTFTAVPVYGDGWTGNDLLSSCQDWENWEDPNITSRQQFRYGICIANITAAINGMFYVDTQKQFCPPETAIGGQFTRVVIRYLKENPQRLHEYYVPLILSAMKEAFPCKLDFPE